LIENVDSVLMLSYGDWHCSPCRHLTNQGQRSTVNAEDGKFSAPYIHRKKQRIILT
jgi:hypothetical protein